jgi:hypothetical protein
VLEEYPYEFNVGRYDNDVWEGNGRCSSSISDASADINKLHGSKPRKQKHLSMNENIFFFIYQVHHFLVFENKMYYQVYCLKRKKK